MNTSPSHHHWVAVIGAGPAGLYAAQYLARQGIHVLLLNRDIKPGGLAEYGIYPDKYKIRQGLKQQFERILAMPQVTYAGNIAVGQQGDLSLDQLRQTGVQAILVATGAQKNYWLGIPGEGLAGVYQANDVVFHFNRLPGRPQRTPEFGKHVVVIGMGNVMLDLVHYLKEQGQPRTVTAVARRGPTEVKFDPQTLAPVANCLDLPSIRLAVDQARHQTESVNRHVDAFFQLLSEAQEKAGGCEPGFRLSMQFLRSPIRLIGNDQNQVRAVVFEKNELIEIDNQIIARGTGETDTVQADTVIFSIGSCVDDGFGLPVANGNYVTSHTPRFPVDGISYEVYNPELCARCEDTFVTGWARRASEGIVGLARKDAERAAKAVTQYLETLPALSEETIAKNTAAILSMGEAVVDKAGLDRLSEAERTAASENGLPLFKFGSVEEMLRIIRGDHQ